MPNAVLYSETVQSLEKGMGYMDTGFTYARIQEAGDYVRARLDGRQPQFGIVLGSGLSSLVDDVTDRVTIPYADIPHFPVSTAPGHSGMLVAGMLGGQPVIVMQGRVHFYEGYAPLQITLPVRVMHSLGARTLIITNAAGGIHPDFRPGDLMVIKDQINLVGMAGFHPLRGPNDERMGVRFPAMAPAYDPQLIALMQQAARDEGLHVWEGVYAMVSGPSYETPAEIRFLRTIGADAVGMSTAPEVVVARHAGMRVLGLSLITNVAIDSLESVSADDSLHEKVLAVGQQAVPDMARLLRTVIERLPRVQEDLPTC